MYKTLELLDLERTLAKPLFEGKTYPWEALGEIKDFILRVELNVFNASLMNDAIFKFRRYEDSSLSYTGLNRHEADERVGGFDTTITAKEFREITT